MLPLIHIILGIVGSTLIHLIFPSLSPAQILVFFFSTFLIDFDHYLYFIERRKNYNIKQAYLWSKEKVKKLKEISKKERKNYSTGIYIFHGIEPLTLIFILGYFLHPIFYFVAAGMLFHLIFDWINKIFIDPSYPKKFSILADFYKSRIKKSI